MRGVYGASASPWNLWPGTRHTWAWETGEASHNHLSVSSGRLGCSCAQSLHPLFCVLSRLDIPLSSEAVTGLGDGAPLQLCFHS